MTVYLDGAYRINKERSKEVANKIEVTRHINVAEIETDIGNMKVVIKANPKSMERKDIVMDDLVQTVDKLSKVEPSKPKSDTRDKIVESARQLFFEQGYTATAIAQILPHSGVNSGSLYYFFPTKEDLLAAVLEKYKAMLEPVRAGSGL